MKALKVLGIIAIWSATAPLIVLLCIRPLQCNNIDYVVLQRTTTLARMSRSPITVSRVARANLDRLAPCLTHCTDVNRLMIAAANERLLHQPVAAIAYYEQAMQYDRRPELYLNLGAAQAEAGRNPEAIANMVTAGIFNPEMTASVEYLHDDVKRLVDEYQLHIVDLRKKAPP